MDCLQAINVINNEVKCVKHAPYCDRNCGVCDLRLNDKDILDAYDLAIIALSKYGSGEVHQHLDEA